MKNSYVLPYPQYNKVAIYKLKIFDKHIYLDMVQKIFITNDMVHIT